MSWDDDRDRWRRDDDESLREFLEESTHKINSSSVVPDILLGIVVVFLFLMQFG